MNRQLKQSIQKAFESPKPNQQEKARFLRTLPQTKISMWRFILNQAAYLRKWILILSVLLLFPALIGAYYIDKNTLWGISALIPFLAFLAIAEGARSTVYGMSELEMSTRFSMKSVLLARWSVLGLTDTLVLCCLVPLCCISNRMSVIQTGAYLLVPYLLTVNISLWITRRFHVKEAIYGCMSVAVLVSGANIGLRFLAESVYQIAYIHYWILLSVILTGWMIYELYRTMKQTEEYTWNLLLID